MISAILFSEEQDFRTAQILPYKTANPVTSKTEGAL